MSFNTQEVYWFGNSIYLLTDSDTTWGEAQREAIGLGGNLATINNGTESAFLSGLFSGQTVWTGLTDVGSEGNFVWISGEPVTYLNWQVNQPNNASSIEHFVVIGSSSSRWNDLRGDGAFNTTYQGIVEITNPSTPTIYIKDVDVIEPYGGTKEAVIDVEMLGTFNNPILLTYSTADGTAFANSDYTPTSGTLTFNPSTQPRQTQQIRVPIRGDSDDVTGENFFVNLNQPPGAVLAKGQAEITIRERSEVQPFRNSAYVITTTNDKWGTVREEARRLGGDLVTVNDIQEQIFISGLVGNAAKWIGLTDVGEEGDFEWVGGASAYTNWAANQPNNASGIENYVAIQTNGQWNDLRGDGAFRTLAQGIAEIPLSSLTEVNNPLTAPVYRFFNTVAGGHFFTTSEAERDAVMRDLPQYRFEGVGFYAYGAETNLGADIYRFFNTIAGGHFFTSSIEERDAVIRNLPEYNYEGIGMEAAFA